MKKKALIMLLAMSMVMACGCSSEKAKDADTNKDNGSQVESSDKNEEAAKPASAKSLTKQGNPTKIALADIAEEGSDDYKAWIKISTLWDTELSMYSSDLIPSGTQAIVVTFEVSNMDCDTQDLYWCYQFKNGTETIALWNDTSAADKVTVDGNGTYTIVFDANKALGAPIDVVESFQLVFPGLTETTTTTFEVKDAVYITDAKDVSFYKTGKVQ